MLGVVDHPRRPASHRHIRIPLGQFSGRAGEFVAKELGRLAGLSVAPAALARTASRPALLIELFARVSLNTTFENSDDHARNHAAFVEGDLLTLATAYDSSPQPRSGAEASQAMANDFSGRRDACVSTLLIAACIFGLEGSCTHDIIENHVALIRQPWR
jgi:serine/threonine-protein kinase HipA